MFKESIKRNIIVPNKLNRLHNFAKQINPTFTLSHQQLEALTILHQQLNYSQINTSTLSNYIKDPVDT